MNDSTGVSTRTDQHIPALDGVRGVAILLVMVHHLFVLQPTTRIEKSLESVAALGVFGVDLFFVLSGFLITRILLVGGGTPYALGGFYLRRMLRIFPLYYFLLALCFIVLPFAMRAVPEAAAKLGRFQGAANDWLWYVLFLTNFSVAAAGKWRHGVMDVTWSLAIEEQFYLIWPWVVRLCSPRQLERVCLMFILVALGCRISLWVAGASDLTIYVLTPCRMDALAIGGLLAARTFRVPLDSLTVKAAGLVVAVGVPVVVSLAALGLLHYQQPWVYTFGYTLMDLIGGAIIILAITSPTSSLQRSILTNGVLTFFGKYSFAIYLIHLPIRAVIRDLFFGDSQFQTMPGGQIVGQIAFYFIATLGVIPFALLSWHLIEKRALELKRYIPTNRAPS